MARPIALMTRRGCGVQRHLLLQRMVAGGDGGHRPLDEQGVEQSERHPDTEEHTEHHVTQPCRQRDRQRGQRCADAEQLNGTEGDRREHQRRIVRWRRQHVHPQSVSPEFVPR